MIITWSPEAIRTARRFMRDQLGIKEIGQAIERLAEDPFPAESFPWGEYRRLRVGPYRVMYVVQEERITIDRIDRVQQMG
ncbi:type II toxin-antitoxin system RelE/ParE family toxin [Spirillospora sp. NPDC127200]